MNTPMSFMMLIDPNSRHECVLFLGFSIGGSQRNLHCNDSKLAKGVYIYIYYTNKLLETNLRGINQSAGSQNNNVPTRKQSNATPKLSKQCTKQKPRPTETNQTKDCRAPRPQSAQPRPRPLCPLGSPVEMSGAFKNPYG